MRRFMDETGWETSASNGSGDGGNNGGRNESDRSSGDEFIADRKEGGHGVKLLEVSRCAGVLQWLANSRIVTCPSLEHTGTLTWL